MHDPGELLLKTRQDTIREVGLAIRDMFGYLVVLLEAFEQRQLHQERHFVLQYGNLRGFPKTWPTFSRLEQGGSANLLVPKLRDMVLRQESLGLETVVIVPQELACSRGVKRCDCSNRQARCRAPVVNVPKARCLASRANSLVYCAWCNRKAGSVLISKRTWSSSCTVSRAKSTCVLKAFLHSQRPKSPLPHRWLLKSLRWNGAFPRASSKASMPTSLRGTRNVCDTRPLQLESRTRFHAPCDPNFRVESTVPCTQNTTSTRHK